MVLVVAGAYWRGGGTERSAALVYLGAWVATVAVLQLLRHWTGPHVGLALVDTGAAVGLFIVALKSDNYWPSVATGGQISGVVIHAAYFLQPTIWSPAYFVALQITSSAVLTVIAYGVVEAVRAGAPQTQGG